MNDQPYCRLTVLAPRRSVDVALPADVPVAELVPMVLELVGEPGGGWRPETWRPEPWRLSGVAGGPLPAAATLAQLGVLDGELLRIARDAPPPAAPVFDDPVDALAAGAGATRAGDRHLAAGAVLAAVVGAAAVLAVAGPGSPAAAVIAGSGAAAALVLACRVMPAGVAALAAVPLAAAAGWTAMPDPAGAALVAVAAAGTAAAAAQVLVRVVVPALVAAVITAVFATGALVGAQFGLTCTAAAAAVATAAVVAGPLLPRVAIRLAGLPRPVVPADGDEFADADTGPDVLPPEELAERADLARGHLAGLAGACAVTAAAGAVFAATAGGWAGPSFAGVTVVVLGLRARGYADAVPARTTLVVAIGAGIALAALAAGHSDAARLGAAVALLLAVGVGLACLGRAAPLGSPVSRRAVTLLEGLLIAATVPLALGAMDLYRLVRGL